MQVNNKLGYALLVLALSTNADATQAGQQGRICDVECGYWGLSYSPAWQHITDFNIGANDGSTAARYPYIREAGTYLDSNFNWQVQDPQIRFNDSKLWALEASLGYRKNFGRVELEVGFEKFNTRATRLDEDNVVTEVAHLLAKDLAHGVMSGNTDKLGKALAATSPHDIVAFAQAVGRASPSIDRKVCNKKVAVDDSYWTWNLWRLEALNFKGGSPSDPSWSCIDYVDSDRQTLGMVRQGTASPRNGYGLSRRFYAVEDGSAKREDSPGECMGRTFEVVGGWNTPEPCNTASTERKQKQKWWEKKQTNGGWPGTAEGKINTAQGMAGDLVSNLDDDEKATVAGILTRIVSGGEVVELRAVSTTSVMLNACYDFRRDPARVMYPFGCVGLGTNLISISDGHITAKLAYKVKVGLDYRLTPRMTAYASGYYHKVLGEDEYYDIPLIHLVNDRSGEGTNVNFAPASGRSKNYAIASFKMAYTGAEVGVRFGF